jgi:hypothetical protein
LLEVGFTPQSVGVKGSPGSLKGFEEEIPGRIQALGNALEYFQRNPIRSTEDMLDIILAAQSLFFFMRACQQAIFWIRAVAEGSVEADNSALADLSGPLKYGICSPTQGDHCKRR